MESLEDRRLLSLTYITGEYTGTLSVKGGPTYTIVMKITGEDRKGILEGTLDLYTSKTHFTAYAMTGRISGTTISFAIPGANIDLAGTENPSKGTIGGPGKQIHGSGTGNYSVKYFRR
jgi:hypothetical protein